MLLGDTCFAFSFEDTEFKGDLRVRYQYDHKSLADSSAQRHRGRMRLRFGFETKVNDKVNFGFRIASGQFDNRSTNQTYTDFFTTKNLRIDMAYGAFKPAEEFDIILGKFRKAFLVVDDLIWDGDINFEGASVLWESSGPGKLGGLANGGFFFMNEDKSSSKDQYMFYVQPGASFNGGQSFAGKLGLAYYHFENVKGSVPNDDISAGTNTRVDGRLKYNYSSISPNLVLVYSVGEADATSYKLTFVGDYVYSFDSRDSGYLVGMRFGHPKVKNQASWVLYYNYRRLERDAFMDVFPDSDFYFGATNVMGHELILQYAVLKNVIIGMDYYRAKKIEGDEDPVHTLQLDCVFNL
jgi:hypothetical protein